MKKALQTPLVSIIIPTYNRAHLIGETLDSVLAQTYMNWECIVIDDGSTDNTDEILAVYCKKDTRFQYHHRPKDRLAGGNAARNYGFELSKGEYINWLDSDDLMHSNLLWIHLNLGIKKNKKVTISQAVIFKDDISNITGLWKGNDYFEKNIDKPMYEMIYFNLGWATPSALWKTKMIPNKPFDEDLFAAQEWLFHCKQMYRLKIDSFEFIKEKLSFIRKTKSGAIGNTNTGKIRNPNYLRARNKLIKFFIQEREYKYLPLVFRSMTSLVTKIVIYDNKNLDLKEFESLFKFYSTRKWIMFILMKKVILFFKFNFKISKRLLYQVLKN